MRIGLILILFTSQLFSQNLVLPLDISPNLAGNFGELRPNHFHMGLDFKTLEKENLPVIAVADGVISRILISSNGYGKALYIDHPALGITSVYAHLNYFIPEIESYTHQLQYNLKSNTLDTLFLEKNIEIKKGQVIAFSGNTGGSEGPHLHFEIRNTITEHTLNPLKYYPEIKDDIKPTVKSVYIYNIEDFGNIQTVLIPNSKIKQEALNILSNKIGIGVATMDRMNGTDSKFNIYSVELYDNDMLQYKISFDSLDFDNQGYVNHVGDLSKRPEDVYRLFEGDCSKNIFNNSRNGILLNDLSTHTIKLIITDFSGNSSVVNFKIQFKESNFSKEIHPELSCHQEHIFKTKSMEVVLPENTFSFPFKTSFNTLKPIDNELERYAIFKYNTPAFQKYTVKFKDLKATYINKLYLASLNPKNNKTWIGQWNESNYEVTGIKMFGIFSLALDLEKPKIEMEKRNPTSKMLQFKIIDKQSGIKKYNAYIDQKWYLAYYDEKSDMLKIQLNKSTKKLNHSVLIEVEDKVGNINSKKYELFY